MDEPMVNSRFSKEIRMTRRVLCALVALAIPAAAAAQDGFKSPYDIVKGNILKAASQVPEEHYSFKPTPDVRSMGQLFGHIANANFMICSMASGVKSTATGNAEELKTKAEIEQALAASFAFCDQAWTSVDAAKGTEPVDVFGMKHSRASALSFNTAHDWEHYGNLVTYMRLKGMVPPSSQGGGQ